MKVGREFAGLVPYLEDIFALAEALTPDASGGESPDAGQELPEITPDDIYDIWNGISGIVADAMDAVTAEDVEAVGEVVKVTIEMVMPLVAPMIAYSIVEKPTIAIEDNSTEEEIDQIIQEAQEEFNAAVAAAVVQVVAYVDDVQAAIDFCVENYDAMAGVVKAVLNVIDQDFITSVLYGVATAPQGFPEPAPLVLAGAKLLNVIVSAAEGFAGKDADLYDLMEPVFASVAREMFNAMSTSGSADELTDDVVLEQLDAMLAEMLGMSLEEMFNGIIADIKGIAALEYAYDEKTGMPVAPEGWEQYEQGTLMEIVTVVYEMLAQANNGGDVGGDVIEPTPDAPVEKAA
jgi:hypothetical protein